MYQYIHVAYSLAKLLLVFFFFFSNILSSILAIASLFLVNLHSLKMKSTEEKGEWCNEGI